VALLLLFKPLLQRLHQLVPAAHGFDELLFFLGQEFFRQCAQPLVRDLRDFVRVERFESFEHMREDAVELVEIALVLHQRGARQVIELVDFHIDDVVRQRIHQRQIFLQRHRYARGAELVEELEEHGRLVR
jgi:hypothetical protein